MKGLYGALGNELEDIGGDLGGDFGGIQSGYSQGISGIMGDLEPTTAPDQAGFLNTLGTFALAGQNQLSDEQSREAAYNASTRRQGAIEGTHVRRNARADLQDILNDLRMARQDVFRDRGPLVASRLDQLQDRSFDERMALAELALRKRALNMEGASSSALGNYIGNYPLPKKRGNNPNTRNTRNRRTFGRGGTTIYPKSKGFDPRQMG